ncbi:MAG TPA: MFS transporter [Hyphomicrobiaceae bacterium]|nr:MFS transporter [Hyphomicrobiaceae bacterium]
MGELPERNGTSPGVPRARLPAVLAPFVEVERHEIAGLLWSFAFFFFVLCAYYIIRPLRDEMGVSLGPERLQWLFSAVFVVMLGAVPLFGWVVSSFARRRIVPIVYGFLIANLLGFWATFQIGAHGAVVAGTFFVWVSVFNLFVVSLFWSLMSDLYRSEQATRLYGFIAAGGSAGALAGPLFTQSLVGSVGPTNLLLLSALLLIAATQSALVLRRLFAGHGASQGEDRPLGKGLLAGAIAVWRSPYLFRIALWILIANLVSTLFYLEQARIVGETLADRTQRVQLFARLDLAVSAATILAQVFLTARVLACVGLGKAIAILPTFAALGLVGLALSPTLAVIVSILAIERALAFAIANPAVKVLYTVLEPEQKYKAQNFNDTVVFRAGDAASGWIFNSLAKSLGLSLGAVAGLSLPLALLWLALSLRLGRQHAERASKAG